MTFLSTWLVPARPSGATDEAMAGYCEDMSFTITFSPNRSLTPQTSTETQVDIDGTGDCTNFSETAPTGATTTGTVDVTGFTVQDLNGLTCAGGVLVVPGTFDTTHPNMASTSGTAVVSIAGPVVSVVIASTTVDDVPAGVGIAEFVLSEDDTASCAAVATSVLGTFSFAAKSSALEP